MSGMDRRTGAPLDGLGHIRQSVADILSTMIGARVGRREYGSLLPELIDRPMTPPNILRLYAATALALSRWEKRLRLLRRHGGLEHPLRPTEIADLGQIRPHASGKTREERRAQRRRLHRIGAVNGPLEYIRLELHKKIGHRGAAVHT